MRSSSANSRGMSAGSFCKSPSSSATTCPRAAWSPANIAALCPAFFAAASTRVRPSVRSIRARVLSCDPSSTSTSS